MRAIFIISLANLCEVWSMINIANRTIMKLSYSTWCTNWREKKTILSAAIVATNELRPNECYAEGRYSDMANPSSKCFTTIWNNELRTPAVCQHIKNSIRDKWAVEHSRAVADESIQTSSVVLVVLAICFYRFRRFSCSLLWRSSSTITWAFWITFSECFFFTN